LGFGGVNKRLKTLSREVENFMKLDTYKLERGWEEFYLQNPSIPSGGYYGLLPLPQENGSHNFLVFGGQNSNKFLKRTCIFSTNMKGSNKLRKGEAELEEADKFS